MTELSGIKEFNIMGHRFRFVANQADVMSADEVVSVVEHEFKQNLSSTGNTEKALLLVALKFASEKMKLENEIKETLNNLEKSVHDMITHVDDIQKIAD